jgi:hypothetical protein
VTFRSVLRDAVPALLLVTAVTLACVYLLVIDDFVADTGPILERAFGCLYAQAAAIVVGSGIAAFRADVKPFRRGVTAGTIGFFYFGLILFLRLVSEGLSEASGAVLVLLPFGLGAAVIGAGGGLIVRGGP